MKISVITVCYNSAGTLRDTLASVAAQSHPDVEHIIIDGASTDNTLDIVREHGAHVARLLSEPDAGIYDAMNKGFDLATGEVIGFLNADDLFADDRVLLRVAATFEDRDIEACFGDLVYVTEDNGKVVRYWKSRTYEPGSFARGWCPAHPSFYVRRSALDRLGQFDLSYRLAADTEFMLRYLEHGQVRAAYIPQVQVRMRVGGATNRNLRNIVRQNREIFQALTRNGIPFSRVSFSIHKVASRIWQRWVAARLNV